MASKHSSASLSLKKTRSMSKTEDKMALVAQRLSMLQDDADENCNSLTPKTVTDVIPLQNDSTNPVRDVDEDSRCGLDEVAIPATPSSTQTKYKSNKRAMVLFNHHSKQDGKKQCFIQPKQENRNDENLSGASANPGSLNMITQFVEPPAEEKLSAMERAIKIQANLSAAYPSFVKMMIPSNVSGSFWMHPPRKFCNANLPKEDCTIVLVDEAGKQVNTKYLARKYGLSAGWRGYAIQYALQRGDVLVFHLIGPTTFKVYIVREDRVNEVDGAVGVLELDTGAGQMIPGHSTQKVLHTEDSPPMDSASPRNSDNDLGPEVLDGIRFSDSDIKFESIKDFNNFNIAVDGLVIDSKFSLSNRNKYYELCLSQNSFLHQHLLKGMNCNLIIGIILETINIADAIKACDSSTSIEDLQTWKTTLNGFELLGMKVGFLCDKLDQTLHIASELNRVDASKTPEMCAVEQGGGSRSINSIKVLDDKVAELKGVMKMIIDSEVEAGITASVDKYKSKVKQIDKFPW
ncbi:B3 domain-containing protein Os01g0234100-like isoform X2 [Silene latifolia]|uniref:B3 domain-containing protein Os01g0234100-like isoform X2 n=1 Tax=Silene latifolia TaxID=37657 RepID=UPI003D781765